MSGVRVGKVTHFFDRINVAVVQLSNTLNKGDTVHFLGHGSDFTQEISSMQIEHEAIDSAEKGQEVALKVDKPVRKHTSIFLLTDEE